MTEVPSRTLGREYALRLLYAGELSGGLYPSSGESPRPGWWVPDDGLDLDPTATRFANRLWRGVQEHRDALDSEIQSSTTHWRIERMAAIDRNLLRIGIFELTRCEEIPLQVTLSEMVALAKHYGDSEAGAFVNGILDDIAKRIRDSRKAK